MPMIFDRVKNDKTSLGDGRASMLVNGCEDEADDSEPCAVQPGHAPHTIPQRALVRQRETASQYRTSRPALPAETLSLDGSKKRRGQAPATEIPMRGLAK